MRTDGQTDMTKLIVAFRNFAYASKNTVFCGVTPQSARNFRIFLRNMRALSTSTLDSTFLRNVTSAPPKRHFSTAPHSVQKRRDYFSLRLTWQPQLSHLFSSFTDHGSSSSKIYYSYNRSQQDALFLKFILVKNSTCFRQTYCPSSGILLLNSEQLLYIILIMLTVS